MDYGTIGTKAEQYKIMRRDYDPFYQEIYVKQRLTTNMRFLEKMHIFAEIENEIDPIRDLAPAMDRKKIEEKYFYIV